MRHSLTQQVTTTTTDKMASSGAFCNPDDFDSIDQVEMTSETLTSRAGMALFSRCLRNLGLFSVLERLFESMRKSEKGLPIPVLFHQIICFFLDGTRFSLVRFDELRVEGGGRLRRGDRGEPRIDGLLPPDQAFLLRILSGRDLALSQADPAGVSLAALANVFACPGSGGCDSGDGHGGTGQRRRRCARGC